MIDRIRKSFSKAADDGRAALVVFVTAGYPSLSLTLDVVYAVIDAGADLVELGVPFSDPVAEGPVIQESSFRALQAGTTPARCLDMVNEIRSRGVKAPLALMGYWNPILAAGPENFCRDAAQAGADGLIVPDLPVYEAEPLLGPARANNLSFVPMVAPTSIDPNIDQACAVANGFIYCVSVSGVTGVRKEFSPRARALVKRVRKSTDLPIAIGFGISTPEHVAAAARIADGAIVGSALIKEISAGKPESSPERAGRLVSRLLAGTVRDEP